MRERNRDRGRLEDILKSITYVRQYSEGVTFEQLDRWDRNLSPCHNSSKGYWRVAGSGILHHAIGNEALQRQGWPCLMDYHRLIVRVQQ